MGATQFPAARRGLSIRNRNVPGKATTWSINRRTSASTSARARNSIRRSVPGLPRGPIPSEKFTSAGIHPSGSGPSLRSHTGNTNSRPSCKVGNHSLRVRLASPVPLAFHQKASPACSLKSMGTSFSDKAWNDRRPGGTSKTTACFPTFASVVVFALRNRAADSAGSTTVSFACRGVPSHRTNRTANASEIRLNTRLLYGIRCLDRSSQRRCCLMVDSDRRRPAATISAMRIAPGRL